MCTRSNRSAAEVRSLAQLQLLASTGATDRTQPAAQTPGNTGNTPTDSRRSSVGSVAGSAEGPTHVRGVCEFLSHYDRRGEGDSFLTASTNMSMAPVY